MGFTFQGQRIQASCSRVYGPPVSAFGVGRIQRRVYNVKGYSPLYHHDGQHGMFSGCSTKLISGSIRYKIVVHGFIDGFSRFITGVRAHGNNRSTTVIELSKDLVAIHGLPSRVKDDHGGEKGFLG